MILTGVLVMPARQGIKFGLAAFLAVTAIGVASWWAAEWSYHLTPGNDLVFREASNTGALAGFLVFIAAIVTAGSALMLWIKTVNLMVRRAPGGFVPSFSFLMGRR